MRRFWTMTLAVCLMTIGGLAGVSAQQEPPAASNPPNQEGPQSGHPGHAGNGEKRLANLSAQLNLTDAQKEKIRPLLRDETERIKEVRSNSSLTQDEAKRRIAAIHKNTRQRIAAFLTPEQKQQWKELREEHRGGAPEGEQGAPGAPPSTNPPPVAPPPANPQ